MLVSWAGLFVQNFIVFIVENEGVYDPDLFEGDMILTPDQRMAAELGLDVDNPLGRGATIGRQWPRGDLVYVIDSSLCTFEFAVSLNKYVLRHDALWHMCGVIGHTALNKSLSVPNIRISVTL